MASTAALVSLIKAPVVEIVSLTRGTRQFAPFVRFVSADEGSGRRLVVHRVTRCPGLQVVRERGRRVIPGLGVFDWHEVQVEVSWRNSPSVRSQRQEAGVTDRIVSSRPVSLRDTPVPSDRRLRSCNRTSL